MPFAVERPVRAAHVVLKPRRGLDRGAVADRAEPVEVALDLGSRGRFRGRLRHRLRPLLHGHPRLEGRVHPVAEVEVQVPGLEVLEDVREVHVRPAVEIGARAEVDEAERLEVHDPRRPESVPLGRREPEEELRAVRDQLRPRHAGRGRHLLRQTRAPVELAREALADARDRKHALHPVEDLGRRLLDVLLVVAPEEERDVVVLEAHVRRVAREAPGVEEGALVRAPVEGQVQLSRAGHVRVEVRQAPGDGDRQPLRGPGVLAVQLLQHIAQRGPSLGQRARRVGDLRRDHLVVPRRDHDLHAFAVLDPHPVEEVLLGLAALPEMGRRVGEPVDELVDARGAEGRTRRSAEEQLLACELHASYGETRTRPRITRSRLRCTCWKVSGFATCSLAAYRLPWSFHA